VKMKKPLIVIGVLAILALVIWVSLRDSGPRGTEVEVQEVRSSQLLLEIERDLNEAARKQARAAVRQAEVSVRQQEVQLADARRNTRRTKELIADGLVSQEALDAAQLGLDTAMVEVEAQQQAVEQHRSALQRAEDDLARTTIPSPMDGTVIQLNAEQDVEGITHGQFAVLLLKAAAGYTDTLPDEVDALDQVKRYGLVPKDWLGEDVLTHGQMSEVLERFGVMYFPADRDAPVSNEYAEAVLRRELTRLWDYLARRLGHGISINHILDKFMYDKGVYRAVSPSRFADD